MDPNIIDAVAVSGGAIATDFSVWALFLRSDIIIKLVMVVLFVASFWSWTIIIDKWLRVRRLEKEAKRFEESFWSGGSLDELYESFGASPRDPMSAVFASAMTEWRRSTERGLSTTSELRAGLQDRIERAMDVTLGREMERLERYMVFLASAGATAPFIGLFGTVWGIMNSFQAIAVAKDTSLAVIAPGLAEALFTTAMGLIVAIPAVAAYNKFSTDMNRYAQRLDGFAAEFTGILSRQLEESK
ncbi:MAG: protein TolQ [Alphaproteobacteria bacterium]|nr:protein TolQ [Alphaproteobacteria bacterium]